MYLFCLKISLSSFFSHFEKISLSIVDSTDKKFRNMPSNALELIEAAQNRGFYFGLLIGYVAVIVLVSSVGLIIGTIFHNQCPVDPRISTFLIVECVVMTVAFGTAFFGVKEITAHQFCLHFFIGSISFQSNAKDN